MGVGNYATDSAIDTVGVGDGAVVGLVVCGLTVIAVEEVGAGIGRVSGIGDLALGADASGDVWSGSGCGDSFTNMRVLAS